MFNEELAKALQEGIDYAERNHHEAVTLSHILLGLLTAPSLVTTLSTLEVDVVQLALDIRLDVDDNAEILLPYVSNIPIESEEVTVLFDAQTFSDDDKTPLDIFAAIFDTKTTVAAQLLWDNEISAELLVVAFQLEDEVEDPDSPISKYSTNLVKRAKLGKIDPVIGRKLEIERVVQTLSRRKKNNPIFIGEAGVGKTAIAEGLALRIANGDVPKAIKNSEIYSLEIGALLAGTKYRGDFEERVENLLKALKEKPNAILFIDEIHTVIGSGSGSSGGTDMGNLLKPALANGELRCMGATTYAEYRNTFEKDKALARRFTRVSINEPSVDEAVEILQGLKVKYEVYHRTKYTDEAIVAAVLLSKKYITDRKLPDVAIDILDEVGASFNSKGVKHPETTVEDIENTVAGMAGIPIAKMDDNGVEKLRALDNNIKGRVFGQDDAVDIVTQAVKRSRAGLGGDDKPTGSFLFTGPTGVGKTELAKTLADELGVHFQRFDMSEYTEKHSVSKLIGAPAGYVGSDQGGLLTESVKKNPNMVLLLDEFEKAHQEIQNILLQVLDNATLTDNDGYVANFKNVIVILTSNIGEADKPQAVMGFNSIVPEQAEDALNEYFSPEFRNRLDGIVRFNKLNPENMGDIVNKFIGQLNVKLAEKDIKATLTKKAKEYFAVNGYDPKMGARPLARLIQKELVNQLTESILFDKLTGAVKVDIVRGKVVLRTRKLA